MTGGIKFYVIAVERTAIAQGVRADLREHGELGTGGEQGLIASNFFVTLTSANQFLPMKYPCSPPVQFHHAPGGDCRI